jgi:hypothetical protein
MQRGIGKKATVLGLILSFTREMAVVQETLLMDLALLLSGCLSVVEMLAYGQDGILI